MSGQWGSSLFACFDDKNLCLKGAFCPCLVFGENQEKLGGDYTKEAVLYCLIGALYAAVTNKRRDLRQRYGLVEDPNDFLATCCCGGCANCQEAREIQKRGGSSGPAPVSSQPRRQF
ncbi:unnamed protein product [Didymodactylos carnosus]|uniref:PLAC8 family protein n=1 Tax=Didymodactylos carnosus TaxID=1234261 RepID=A0A814NTR1_9BILA|nr:unnamed protein product [Didymodactylos carnosus]CAF3862916.1 unnamed protein product [Didymodactylos carnosus]